MRPFLTAANEIDETLPVRARGTLFVDLERGRIEVRSHDASAVRIQARARGWASWGFAFDVACDEDDVRLTGESLAWGIGPFGGLRVSVCAWVPRHCSVDLRTKGGQIELAALSGRVFAETGGGSIDLDDIEGLVAVRSSGGRIRARNIEGNLRADTSGGAVTVTQVTGEVQASTSGGDMAIDRVMGSVAARTGGGNIAIREAASHVDAITGGGNIIVVFVGEPSGSLKTSGGNIEAFFPAEVGGQLDAETQGGRIDLDEQIQLQGKSEPWRVTGEINGGGPSIRLRASGGNIRVRAVAAPEPVSKAGEGSSPSADWLAGRERPDDDGCP